MALYLVVKVVWVAAGLLDVGSDSGHVAAEWMLLNGVTILMAVVGVALGLALAQPWGQRLPGTAVVFFSWVATGLLVTVVPFAALRPIVEPASGASAATHGDGGSVMAAWESALITIGVVGMALGLVIALPIYLRERWPHAFVGRLRELPRGESVGRDALGMIASALATIVGAAGWYWALGGTIGLGPNVAESQDSARRALIGVVATWSLIGAWSARTTVRRRARVRTWVPVLSAWAASGSLFAWNAWEALIRMASPEDMPQVHDPIVGTMHLVASLVAGLLILAVVMSIPRERSLDDGEGQVELPHLP